MIKVVQGDRQTCQSFVEDLKSRVGQASPEIEQTVRDVIEQVRAGGDSAVKAFSEKFDGWTPENLELSREALEQAVAECDPAFIQSLRKAAENIRAFHQRQKQQSRIDPMPNGIITGQRVRGLHRVGVYVPGGTAGYPSSVLMNVIPAQVAEVGEIVMATPPGRTGRPDPNILAAAYVAGVDRVFLMGGAQAVAALALGTESVPKVDKIVGPGNIFVATAKKQLYGVVDIDMIAGPSEILIVADESANPTFLAADLMSQAEHDRMASAILITPSRELAERTVAEVYRQMEYLSRKEIISTDDVTMIPIYFGVGDEANQGLCTGSENYWCVNKNASEEDIQATLDFMYWCVTNETALAAITGGEGAMPSGGAGMGFAIPFKAAPESQNLFVKLDAEMTAEGKTPVSWNFTTMPSEEWKNLLGSKLAAYAADQTDENWAAVVSAFVDNWAAEYALANG